MLICIPIVVFAQPNSICSCTSSYGLQPYHTGGTHFDRDSEEPVVFRAYFILQEDTADMEGLDEITYLEAVAFLNIHFNPFNIFFKYIGFEFVDDIRAHFDNEYFPDRINIRINDVEDGGAVAGFPFPLNIIITPQAFTNELDRQYLLAHEVGHILGLDHINGVTGAQEGSYTNPPLCNGAPIATGFFPSLDTSSVHETVTRDINDPDYNADEAGDFIVDTAAAYFTPTLCINNASGIPTIEYAFSNEVVDGVNVPYENIDASNWMISLDQDVNEFNAFFNSFTPGQVVRMRETIANEPDLQPAKTTVASLYEPYSGSYFEAGPNLPEHTPLFQPGFDYKFVSAGGQTPFGGYQSFNQPTAFEDINFIFDSSKPLNTVDRFSLDLEMITHPNRSAIIIEQVDAQQPRRAYHNINRAASGGMVIKFLDNVPNTNYTLTPKDSLGINEPTLIQDLENGLYLIEKNYNDGTQEQETIFKTNTNE